MSDLERLTSLVEASPLPAPILARWTTVEPPDSWLVAIESSRLPSCRIDHQKPIGAVLFDVLALDPNSFRFTDIPGDQLLLKAVKGA